MTRSAPSRLSRNIQDGIFYGLLLACFLMAGWLVARHDRVSDWTASQRNTLSEASRGVLAQLQSPLLMTVFAPDDRLLRQGIERLLAPYRRERPDIRIRFADPELDPEQARGAGVRRAGELRLEYEGRRATPQDLSEPRITEAITRLLLAEPRWITALEGHGERRVEGRGSPDLGDLSAHLRESGLFLQGIDLATHPVIPDNTHALLLSTPQIALFSGEVGRLLDYLDRGGNLLWLLEPAPWNGLEPLAAYLGVERLPGVVVDANASELNLDDPSIALVPRYPDHPATRSLQALSLFPGAAALRVAASPDWTAAPLLATLERSWNETGPLRGTLTRDGALGEMAGPLVIGLGLTRTLKVAEETREQRVVILGDGDFLSNGYLGNSGNRDLALNLMRWLTAAEWLLDIPVTPAGDQELNLSADQVLWLTLMVLGVLPLLFLCTGLLIGWWRQRA